MNRPAARIAGVAVVLIGMVARCGGQMQPCGAGQVVCDGACASLDSDPRNCGACGNVCANGLVCQTGVCATSCGGGTTQCQQSCFDTQIDPHHCGSCDNVCASGQACVAGACTSGCGNGQTLCQPDGGPYCANTMSDNANCGGCEQACGAGTTCVQGACINQCAPGLTACGAACVDLNSDLSNCGQCGQVCTECLSGQCLVALAMDPYASFYGIAVDANYVYWSEGTGLYRIDKSGVAATKKQLYAANGGQWYFSVAAAPTGSPLVWTVTNTYVGTVGVFNGTSTTYFNEPPVWSIALDAKNVYWTTDTGLIRTAPIGGTTAMTIASGQSNANVVHSIASDGTSVFWTSHNDGTILSQPIAQLDGGTSSVIISGEIQPDVLAVDATNLYWCAYPQLRSAPKNGTGTTTTLVQFTSGCLDFAIDATSLYFFDLNGVERVPLGGGPVTTVVDAKAYGGGGNAIAVDATNVYWLAGGPTGTVWKATLK